MSRPGQEPRTVAGFARLSLALACCLAGSAHGDPTTGDADCAQAPVLGYFNPDTDLFLAQFDIKTDVDDLHSAAAVAMMLASPAFACVRYLAVAGTYGIQDGDFVPAPTLFDRAFGQRWRDAHGQRQKAVHDVADLVLHTLETGGDVWIMEAGQSDFSFATLTEVLEHAPAKMTRARVHVVQHSDWNEEVTSADALAFVREHTDYHKIPDGNAVGNGSPGLRTSESDYWQRALADEAVGPVWREAKRVADAYNGKGYDNEAVGAGGMDFSDTVEALHIFGLMDLEDTRRFMDYFLGP